MLEYGYELRWFRRNGWLLCLIWTLGLLLGAAASHYGGEIWAQALRQAAASPVRLTGAIAAAALPLVLTAAGVLCFGRSVSWAVCFLRAVLLGITAGAVGQCIAAGLPAAAGLILVPSMISTPFLLLYWWRRLCVGTEDLLWESGILLAIGMASAAIDCWMIAPYLTELLND